MWGWQVCDIPGYPARSQGFNSPHLHMLLKLDITNVVKLNTIIPLFNNMSILWIYGIMGILLNNMKCMQNEEYFSTRDISLAATLLTLKFKMVGLDMQYEGTVSRPVGYFLFQRTEDVLETEKKYWARSLAIEPMLYQTHLKSLKAQVMNVYKSPQSGYNKKYKTY
jgi:hypothetical protein